MFRNKSDSVFNGRLFFASAFTYVATTRLTNLLFEIYAIVFHSIHTSTKNYYNLSW